MKNYFTEVETVDGGIKAVLIGGGYMAQKLSLILNNRGLGCSVISRPKDLDLSSTPEFIFMFNNNGELAPEAFLNFVEAIKSKIIIVSTDGPCGEDLVRQFREKDADYCSVSVYDLFGGSGTESALESIFQGIAKKKIISFKNDQIVISPVFVDDVAEALCRIAFSTQTYKKNFLLTGKEEIPLIGFIQRVWAEGSRNFGTLPKPEETEKEYPEIIPRHEKILKRDNSYLLLSWQPEMNLNQGIASALNNLKLAPVSPQPGVKKKTAPGPKNFLLLEN